MTDLNSGALAPVEFEVEFDSLEVVGTLPSGLEGVLLRNGPNPFGGRFAAETGAGDDMLSWWVGAAMLHAIEFAHGQAAYKNRWVRTKAWSESQYEPSAGDSDDVAWLASNPNVNVVEFDDNVWALADGGLPVQVSRDIETLSQHGARFHQPTQWNGMAAHPKIDVKTGEMVTFHSNWSAPYLRYAVVSKQGEVLHSLDIDLPAPAMMHDMAITSNYSVVFDANVGYDFDLLNRGMPLPLRWYDERNSRIGVIPRHGDDLRWFLIEDCFIQHVANAYEDSQGRIVLDVVRYASFLRLDESGLGYLPNPLGKLWRYTLDLSNGRIEQGPLSDPSVFDCAVELPRINEQYTGHKNDFIYAVMQPSDSEMRGVVKLDLAHNTYQTFDVPLGDQNSEPVFVPNLNTDRSCQSSPEDDGWLLVCVYRAATDTSEIVVLDARRIDQPPLAVVKLPCRIPAGFHGAFVGRARA